MTLYGDVATGWVRGTLSTCEGEVGHLWVVKVADVYCTGSKSSRVGEE